MPVSISQLLGRFGAPIEITHGESVYKGRAVGQEQKSEYERHFLAADRAAVLAQNGVVPREIYAHLWNEHVARVRNGAFKYGSPQMQEWMQTPEGIDAFARIVFAGISGAELKVLQTEHEEELAIVLWQVFTESFGPNKVAEVQARLKEKEASGEGPLLR